MRLVPLFFFVIFYGYSQSSDPANKRYWDSGASLYARGFLGLEDKHFAICGESFLYFGANPYAGGFVVYSDSSGANHWERAYTAFNPEFSFESITHWSDSSILIGGSMLNPITNLHGGSLLKLDKTGNLLWKGSIENGVDFPIYVRKTRALSDSTALVIGANMTPGQASFIMKIDSAGNKLWGFDLLDNNGEILNLKGITELSNGDLVLCGNVSENFASGNIEWRGILIKTDSLGAIKWTKKFNQPNSGFSDVITDQTNLYLRNLGMTSKTSNGILAVDTSGALVWQVDAFVSDDTSFPERHRLLTFDADSSLVFYFDDFFSSKFMSVSRDGTSLGALNAQGRAAGYSSHTDSTQFLLLCGPVYGVKSSLVSSEHFVVSYIDEDPQKASCTYPSSMECTLVTGFELLAYSLATGDSYTINQVLMEEVTWFPTIDNNCVELLGGLDDVDKKSFNVYPNPATDQIKVNMMSEDYYTGRGGLFDAFGKQLNEFSVFDEIQLDIRALAPGLYFVEIDGFCRPFIKK